jgi:hypothetical protein
LTSRHLDALRGSALHLAALRIADLPECCDLSKATFREAP